MKLTIQYSDQQFHVYNKDILLLELELNKTQYGKEWSHIGDYLYNYYVKEDCLDQPKSTLEVTSEQYTFLLELYNKLPNTEVK